jgi:hypothetical protein
VFRQHKAPTLIEYLSVDVEGSELEILESFDFDAYKFGVITVEHGYRNDRSEILKLLSSKGYQRVLEHVSWWDDWYVQTD